MFDIIITTEDVKNQKPHPESVEKALEFLHGKKEETIIIGDSNKDIELAKNAKVDSVLFYPKEHAMFYDIEKLKSYKPTYIIDSLSQLINHL